MQVRQRIFKLTAKAVFRFFPGQNLETVTQLTTCLSTTNRRKVINSEKQSSLFWPTLYKC